MRRYLAIMIMLCLAATSYAQTLNWTNDLPQYQDVDEDDLPIIVTPRGDINDSANWSGTLQNDGSQSLFFGLNYYTTLQMDGAVIVPKDPPTLRRGEVVLNSSLWVNTVTIQPAITGYGCRTTLLQGDDPTATLKLSRFDFFADGDYGYASMNFEVPTAGTLTINHALGNAFAYHGNLYGASDTTVLIEGAKQWDFNADNSETFLGTIKINGGKLGFQSTNGLGGGVLLVDSGTQTLQHGTSNSTFLTTSLVNDFRVEAGARLDFTTHEHVIINGNIGGTGTFATKNSNADGMLYLEGNDNRDATIDNKTTVMHLNGTFTDMGDVKANAANYPDSAHGWGFAGTGNVGMAQDKAMLLAGNASYRPKVAPGTFFTIDNTDPANPVYVPGEVGTLTVGTAGRNNQVKFGNYAQLQIDVVGEESDTLAINGKLDLNGNLNALHIVGALQAGKTYTLASYTEGLTGVTTIVEELEVFTPYMFKEVLFNGVAVGDPLAEGAFGTTHSLVYGENALQLVALNAGPNYRAGDTDKNLNVDPADLMTLLDNWAPTASDKVWAQGDFDGNGNVDPADLMALLDNWSPTGYTPVPEPATIALLSIGGLALIRRRK